MKLKRMIKLIISLSILNVLTVFADLSPVGFWAAKDDHTGQVLSVIQIWQDGAGSYNGRVYEIKNITVNGVPQKADDICKTCTGNLLNKPMLCLQVVYDMQQKAGTTDTWENGKAYDPKSDNTYHAKMWLTNKGNTLSLRGFIMMPLFGRTQEWTRVAKPESSKWTCNRSIADTYHL